MDPSLIRRHVINNCEGPRTIQYKYTIVTFIFLYFDLLFIKFLINTREKQELPVVEPGTSRLLALHAHVDV